MNLLFFNNTQKTCRENRVCGLVAETIPEISIKMFSQLDTMLEWLHLPPRDFFAAVIIPDDSKVLTELIKVVPYFADRKSIIILPENDSDALSLARKFGFSYIHNDDNDFSTVISLLENWMQSEKKARKWIE